ncbi:MAG: hypothetical protein M0R06_01310 [Sphaerochaeta sp.]|jgi:hypothetical protein|nr:hypothetical protein [Sphaerochaeta sp.]
MTDDRRMREKEIVVREDESAEETMVRCETCGRAVRSEDAMASVDDSGYVGRYCRECYDSIMDAESAYQYE